MFNVPSDIPAENPVEEVLAAAVNTANSPDLSGFRNTSVQLILLIALFAAFFYVLYIVYKYFLPGGKRVFGKNRNMSILEITSVGPGSTIQLVKVSEEYFLVGVTKTHVSFMTKLDPSSVAAGYETQDEGGEVKPKFIDVFTNVIRKR